MNAAKKKLTIRGVRCVAAALCAVLLVGAELAAEAVTPEVAGSKGAVITIHGEINDILADSLARRVAEAQEDGATTIILEMDTPGGLVVSALDISKMIRRWSDEGLHTVAWVNDDAYSAGALISLAANEIYMATSGSIGDCAPIMVTPAGMEELGAAERAKAESPILEDFRTSSLRNGYDVLLTRSMVSVGTEVWWLENVETGEREFVDGATKRARLGDPEPAAQRDVKEVSFQEAGLWRLVETAFDPLLDKDVPIQQPIDSETELLTLSASEALLYGIAAGTANDKAELAGKLGLAGTPATLDKSGWERFATWLNSPLVRGLLFIIILLGAYIEFQSPGLIVPGSAALVALAIFLGAPYAAGLADIWTFVLLGLGILLIGLEIFVIPGFGVAGILGFLAIVISFVGTFVPAEPVNPGEWDFPIPVPTLQGTWDALQRGIMVLGSSLMISVAGIALLARFLPSMRTAEGLVLGAAGDADAAAVPDAHTGVALVGDVGIVTGDLRPGGQARFGSEIVDVCSQGEYVDAGQRVQVLQRDGMRIVVRPLPTEHA